MLHFLVGTFIALLIIYLVIVSPAFRKATLVLVLLVTAAFVFMWKQGERETREREQQLAAQESHAVTAIRPDQLVLTDMNLTKEQYGDWWTLTGTVANKSGSDLGSIQFLVTMRDCPSGNCRTVGQETVTARNDEAWQNKPLVPAGQVRTFSSYALGFKNMPPVTDLRWEAKVVQIRATRQPVSGD